MKDTNIYIVLIKATICFIVLFSLTRFLGKKEMSKLTFFNYITGITTGSLTAHIMTLTGKAFFYGIAALIWWGALTWLAGFISLKSRRFSVILNGEPTIVIKKGKIMKKAMASSRLNIDDLNTLLREQKIFSIKDIDYAILESNGHLSVLKKPGQKTITKKDMNIFTASPLYFPTTIIINGKVIERNLKELNLDGQWLNDKLKFHGVDSIEDVFYAEVQSDGTLHVDTGSRSDNT